jgi:flavin-dependent dehydrogenase
VARALDPGSAKEAAIAAQEIELPLAEGEARALRLDTETPQLWFTRDLAGYGWAFRKGDYLNVGLGRRGADRLHEELRAFVAGLRAAGCVPASWGDGAKGHAYLTYGSTRRPLVGACAALIGDAAGVASPKSGEGIRPAVESGLLLARALAKAGDVAEPAALARYAADVIARFGPRGAKPAAPPPRWQAALATRLFGVRAFARHVVVERWFLNAKQPEFAS